MERPKLTDNELKTQRDSLERFQRYLPILQIKEQQLRRTARQVETAYEKLQVTAAAVRGDIASWVELLGGGAPIHDFIAVESVMIERGNVAGVDIPVFQSIVFKKIAYDLFATPPWVDKAVETVKRLVAAEAELEVVAQQKQRIEEELRMTVQRINLLEKVKIPEAREKIRRLRIYLGDRKTAAHVRDKICKKKRR